MTDPTNTNELQALNKLHTDVDSVRNNVILVSHCIKAQDSLLEKLKNDTKRNQEQCYIIKNANMKLESEIAQAELELKNKQLVQESMRMANINLKKELLLIQQRNEDFLKRVERKKKEYEDHWLECNRVFESLPFGQKYVKAKADLEGLIEKKEELDKLVAAQIIDMKAKKAECKNIDQQRIVEFAEYMVRTRPKLLAQAQEKGKAVRELNLQLNSLQITVEKPTEAKPVEVLKVTVDKGSDEGALFMPRLQLDTVMDFDDMVSLKMKTDLDKNKKITEDLARTSEAMGSPSKAHFAVKTSTFKTKSFTNQPIITYFHTAAETQDFSKKKLINILDDVRIDTDDAMKMISEVNPDSLQAVATISAEAKPSESPVVAQNKTAKEPVQSDIIDEIDTPTSNSEDVLIPPTLFQDLSKSQKSQEKKTVSFDLTNENVDVCGNTGATRQDDEMNETMHSQLDVSAVSDDGFMKIQDMVLKKHNLDLSPQFMYAKNKNTKQTTVVGNISEVEEKVIKSKFFDTDKPVLTDDKQKTNSPEVLEIEVADKTIVVPKNNSRKIIELGVDDVNSSPKKQKIEETCKPNKSPFRGYLFNHGPQGLPESLDLSLNTTAYEDADFPHYIASSLLLSPKADIPTSIDNPAVESQEVPNFLSGLRKTGFSFFGSPAGDAKADSSSTSKGTAFTFSFGGEEKKNRGGLFNMFK